METLRNLLLGLVITCLAIAKPLSSTGQDNSTAIPDAFTKSYTYEKSGEYSKAVEEIKKVYDEKSYEINLRLGWLTYSSGLFTESLAYYQKALTLMPYAIEPKFGYTYPAAALGNWEQVKTQYNEILKIDPNNTKANYKLGSIYYGAEDFNTAYKYFEKVVNLWPFDYDGVLMFAWTNFKLGKLREAKVLFNKALLLKPDDTSAKEGLGLIK
jgi:tetratricopeptide (TPR) repeat protein